MSADPPNTADDADVQDIESLLILQLLVGHEFPSAIVTSTFSKCKGNLAETAIALFLSQKPSGSVPDDLIPQNPDRLTVSQFEAIKSDLDSRKTKQKSMMKKLSETVNKYLSHSSAGDLNRLAEDAQKLSQTLADYRYATEALQQFVTKESAVSHQPDPTPLREGSPSRSSLSSSSASPTRLSKHTKPHSSSSSSLRHFPQPIPPQNQRQMSVGHHGTHSSTASSSAATDDQAEENPDVIVSAEAEALTIYFKWDTVNDAFKTNPKDWIGLFHYGDKRNMKVQKEYIYTGGEKSGSGCFLVPKRGIYELRYYRKGSSTPVYRTTQPITVGASVKLMAELSENGRQVIVSVDPCAVEGKKDWIGLYHVGSWSKHYIACEKVKESTRTELSDMTAEPSQSSSAHASVGSSTSSSTDEVLESSAAAAQSCTTGENDSLDDTNEVQQKPAATSTATDPNTPEETKAGTPSTESKTKDGEPTSPASSQDPTIADADGNKIVSSETDPLSRKKLHQRQVLPESLLREGATECRTAVLRLCLPAPRQPGNYEVRYFCEKPKYQAKGCSPIFVVPNRDEMSVLQTAPELMVQWRVLSQVPSTRDWIGVFDSADEKSTRITYEYCSHHRVADDGMHDSGVVTFNSAALQQAMDKKRGYENGIYTWEIRFFSSHAKKNPYLRIPLILGLTDSDDESEKDPEPTSPSKPARKPEPVKSSSQASPAKTTSTAANSSSSSSTTSSLSVTIDSVEHDDDDDHDNVDSEAPKQK